MPQSEGTTTRLSPYFVQILLEHNRFATYLQQQRRQEQQRQTQTAVLIEGVTPTGSSFNAS